MKLSNKFKKNEFGKRIASLRKERGLTQVQLGEKIGVSHRMIAYYESKYPPTHFIVPLAKALKISTDELLGVKNLKSLLNPEYAALWRRLKKVEILPRRAQQALFQVLEGLLEKHHSKSK